MGRMTQTDAASLPLICPEERAPLVAEGQEQLCCSACGRRYRIEAGVLRLSQTDDAFYEGAYHNHVAYLPRGEAPWQILPLWLVNSGYPWAVRRHVEAGRRVIELGCAGGVRYFGQRYTMIGCDVSHSSLERLAGVYAALIQVDAGRCIPLADASVDAVVSSYFWEHVPPASKLTLAAECARVLRPGGKLIFLYDVETQSPLIERYKRRDAQLYRRLFIEGDGHWGYETLEANRAVFEGAGLRVVQHAGLEKTPLQSASVFSKLAEFDGRGRRAFALARALGQRPWFYPYTALVRAVDTVVAPWLPERWARIALSICEKPR
jgi:SAM-dependent methyltransferase